MDFYSTVIQARGLATYMYDPILIECPSEHLVYIFNSVNETIQNITAIYRIAHRGQMKFLALISKTKAVREKLT